MTGPGRPSGAARLWSPTPNSRLNGPIYIDPEVLRVAICCVTLRRPRGLRRLLEGLNALTFQKTAPEPAITVVVIDNDGAAPMRSLIDAVRPGFRWPLHYDCESEQGVSSARNRALDLVPAETDYIASIDDDEVPEPCWLDELLHVGRTYGAPIVQGPVHPCFPSPPPDWLVRGSFFELGPYEDGASLHFAYAGNSLIDATMIRRMALRFDTRFDRTGGEDQHFYSRAIAAGHRVITAEKAVVHEWVPASRTTLSYLLRRRFRMGTTLAMIDRIEGGGERLALRAAKGVGRIGLGLAQTATVVLRGFAGLANGLCTMAWGAGALGGVFGLVYHEYDGRQTPLRHTAWAPRPGRSR